MKKRSRRRFWRGSEAMKCKQGKLEHKFLGIKVIPSYKRKFIHEWRRNQLTNLQRKVESN
uniref:Uncharacterized protein n=1 Tax=Tetraselmis sp. GSL018 TaxID=582737 RepID=A0A061RB54_9CHLO